MVVGEVIKGSPEVGLIVFTPPPAMLKVIVSTTAFPFALASRIAWRRLPAPLSFVLVTTKPAASTLRDKNRLSLNSVQAATPASMRAIPRRNDCRGVRFDFLVCAIFVLLQ